MDFREAFLPPVVERRSPLRIAALGDAGAAVVGTDTDVAGAEGHAAALGIEFGRGQSAVAQGLLGGADGEFRLAVHYPERLAQALAEVVRQRAEVVDASLECGDRAAAGRAIGFGALARQPRNAAAAADERLPEFRRRVSNGTYDAQPGDGHTADVALGRQSQCGG